MCAAVRATHGENSLHHDDCAADTTSNRNPRSDCRYFLLSCPHCIVIAISSRHYRHIITPIAISHRVIAISCQAECESRLAAAHKQHKAALKQVRQPDSRHHSYGYRYFLSLSLCSVCLSVSLSLSLSIATVTLTISLQ